MIQHVDYGKPRRALLNVIDLLAEYGRLAREENGKADSTSGKEHESAAETTSPERKSGVLP
jgi:hypothetical protein